MKYKFFTLNQDGDSLIIESQGCNIVEAWDKIQNVENWLELVATPFVCVNNKWVYVSTNEAIEDCSLDELCATTSILSEYVSALFHRGENVVAEGVMIDISTLNNEINMRLKETCI